MMEIGIFELKMCIFLMVYTSVKHSLKQQVEGRFESYFENYLSDDVSFLTSITTESGTSAGPSWQGLDDLTSCDPENPGHGELTRSLPYDFEISPGGVTYILFSSESCMLHIIHHQIGFRLILYIFLIPQIINTDMKLH